MTRLTIALLLAYGALAYSKGALDAPASLFASRSLDQDEQTAVELQCRSMDGVLRSSCETETSESLVAGAFDPEPILCVHCTRFDNLWATGDIEIPPDLCIQRYGGWLHG